LGIVLHALLPLKCKYLYCGCKKVGLCLANDCNCEIFGCKKVGVCLANDCNCEIFVWIVIKSDWCDIKYKKNLKLFHRKLKKFCFIVYLFIWIIKKNYCCDIKRKNIPIGLLFPFPLKNIQGNMSPNRKLYQQNFYYIHTFFNC
jgi:hypothetical protein